MTETVIETVIFHLQNYSLIIIQLLFKYGISKMLECC